jgi:hypothetical protein
MGVSRRRSSPARTHTAIAFLVLSLNRQLTFPLIQGYNECVTLIRTLQIKVFCF